jgi:hypothetical protein
LRADGPEFWPDGSSAYAGWFCGSVVIAPEGESPVALDSLPGDCPEPNEPDTSDAFLARYAEGGALEWVVHALSPGMVQWWDPHVRRDASVVVRGWADDEVVIHDVGGLAAMSDAGSLIVAYDADGALAWSRRIVGDGGLSGIAVTTDGRVVAVMSIDGSVTFEPGTDEELVLYGAGIYGAGYSAGGDLEWAGVLLDASAAAEWYVSPVAGGDTTFAFVGSFMGDVVVAPAAETETALAQQGFRDYFVAVFDAAAAR